ncbi:hypothetical protein cand_035780 [Cryptosporidium andersoni]|uniref:Uncharacterized protein n=1 Tax=Cryptosporidium andersoni TaxID=117008 RepID=A0A1J4MVP7_9CRYT|nr:hypothetical protein cand_035780 [Cryptosporidium andersoni]
MFGSNQESGISVSQNLANKASRLSSCNINPKSVDRQSLLYNYVYDSSINKDLIATSNLLFNGSNTNNDVWVSSTEKDTVMEFDRAREVWVTIPIVFPSASIHNITSVGNRDFGESIGGSLCFSPEQINESRLFSSIQGLADIGASFFQLTLAKIHNIRCEDEIEIIQQEFRKLFNYQNINKSVISLKPVGWRKRNNVEFQLTIPLINNNEYEYQRTKEQTYFYNALLVAENKSEKQEILYCLNNILNIFINSIQQMIPTLEISKITNLYDFDYFEITIRLQDMPSYIASEGEDLDRTNISNPTNCNQYSEKTSLIPSICFGDIRLINPYDIQTDSRFPCGMFKTFALVRNETVLYLADSLVETYIPLIYNRKQYNSFYQFSIDNKKDMNINLITNYGQFINKTVTPKLTYSQSITENDTITPHSIDVVSSPISCVPLQQSFSLSNNNSISQSRNKKNYATPPTTKFPSTKPSMTPFTSASFISYSATDLDSSPWISNDNTVLSSSSAPYYSNLETQQLLPPRISTLNTLPNEEFFNTKSTNNSVNYWISKYEEFQNRHILKMLDEDENCHQESILNENFDFMNKNNRSFVNNQYYSFHNQYREKKDIKKIGSINEETSEEDIIALKCFSLANKVDVKNRSQNIFTEIEQKSYDILSNIPVYTNLHKDTHQDNKLAEKNLEVWGLNFLDNSNSSISNSFVESSNYSGLLSHGYHERQSNPIWI